MQIKSVIATAQFVLTRLKSVCLHLTLPCPVYPVRSIVYRSAGHPGHWNSIHDHPVVIRQSGHVWVGTATDVEVGLRRQGCRDGLQVGVHRTNLVATHTVSVTQFCSGPALTRVDIGVYSPDNPAF